jgi:hypothetical protein
VGEEDLNNVFFWDKHLSFLLGGGGGDLKKTWEIYLFLKIKV